MMKYLKWIIYYVLVMTFIYFMFRITEIVSTNPSILDGVPYQQLHLVVALLLAHIFKVYLLLGIILALCCIFIYAYGLL